jgi:uncharacterized protein YcbK (DUF882 family)
MAKYFTRQEFACQYTGKNEISSELIDKLDELREACGFSFIITSGYRDATHPVEAKKAKPGTGTHAQGIAADIKVNNGLQRFKIVEKAIALGFTGVGVARSFVHVDIRSPDDTTPFVMWTY